MPAVMEPSEIDKTDLGKKMKSNENSENDLAKSLKSSKAGQKGMPKVMETTKAHEKTERQNHKRRRSDSQSDSVSEVLSVGNENSPSPELLKPDYVPGDLVWVKIGSYPFWPSMVIESPVEKISYRRTKNSFVYYVQYFGIDVMHGWTLGPRYVLPYEGEESYQTFVKQRSKSKIQRKFYARRLNTKALKSSFEKALEEIEEAQLTRPLWKRHRTFRFLFPQEGKPDSDEISDSELKLPTTASNPASPETPQPQHFTNEISSNESTLDPLASDDLPITDITNAASRVEGPQKPTAIKHITSNRARKIVHNGKKEILKQGEMKKKRK